MVYFVNGGGGGGGGIIHEGKLKIFDNIYMQTKIMQTEIVILTVYFPENRWYEGVWCSPR